MVSYSGDDNLSLYIVTPFTRPSRNVTPPRPRLALTLKMDGACPADPEQREVEGHRVMVAAFSRFWYEGCPTSQLWTGGPFSLLQPRVVVVVAHV